MALGTNAVNETEIGQNGALKQLGLIVETAFKWGVIFIVAVFTNSN